MDCSIAINSYNKKKKHSNLSSLLTIHNLINNDTHKSSFLNKSRGYLLIQIVEIDYKEVILYAVCIYLLIKD